MPSRVERKRAGRHEEGNCQLFKANQPEYQYTQARYDGAFRRQPKKNCGGCPLTKTYHNSNEA